MLTHTILSRLKSRLEDSISLSVSFEGTSIP